ncbi:MAG TPA: cupin domain-containing protein [Solirubrobacteraceae bacterium]|jgi:mannose-6-phosphate isomerase-like protein (cupin superfamily)
MRPQIDILLDTDQSNDIVGIVKLTVPPEWGGPPLHHHDFDEAFYVLEGELTFQLGEQLRTAGPGELVFAPRGAIHTLANLSGQQARYVLVCTPGEFTRYFQQLNAPKPAATTEASPKSYPPTIVVGPTIPERLVDAA